MLLVFFVVALLFTAIIGRRGFLDESKHHNWLAAFLFLGAMYLCPFMFGYATWYSKDGYREFLFFIPFQQLFLLGPVFYFFVRSLLSSRMSFSKKDAIHFLPGALYLVYSLIIFVVDVLILDEFYFYADGKDKDLDYWYQISGFISMLFYLILSLRYYVGHRRRSLEEVSFADEIAFKWVMNFTIAFSVILVLRILFFILNPEWWNFGSKFWYYLCFSIMITYIAINGYTNALKSAMRGTLALSMAETKAEPTPLPEIDAQKDEIDLSKWKSDITQLFEKGEPYTNSSFTLSDLAGELSTNRNVISKVINQEFGMNFNDFVNHKRAQAMIQKLQNGEHQDSTLLGLAYECGFNSKTTFHRAFKKHTGLTPKQFIDQNEL